MKGKTDLEIENLCAKYTDLEKEDVEEIESFAYRLEHFSELAESDVFIDCFSSDMKKGVVVAHGRPAEKSQYRRNITGDIVLPKNEPMVFYTMETGKPIRDAKGFSQEGKWVLQRTLAIDNKKGRRIGVLIEERDVTESIEANIKLRKIENRDRALLTAGEADEAGGDVIDRFSMIQEMHHRIKNSLQIISSILSMQERRSRLQETKDVLKDNINRINNIARIHETLMSDDKDSISLNDQISILASSMMNYASSENKRIVINVTGDRVIVPVSRIIPLLMVVNELLTNSIRHGYAEEKSGGGVYKS